MNLLQMYSIRFFLYLFLTILSVDKLILIL